MSMPAIVELRLQPARLLQPATRQLHGLACTLFEGAHADGHLGQAKQFTIWPLHPDPDGWLLRAAWLSAGLPQPTFHSPTFFSQNGTHVVLPDPRLIVGSWRRRWNASLPPQDPLAIDDDHWRELHQALHLAAFGLRTQSRDAGHGHDQPGFTGTATLRLAKNATPAACHDFGTLARFAEFCGTGAQTTHGFGATSTSAAHHEPLNDS
jgi:CRISPR-associated endoribonuclease Cas6